LLDVQNWDFGWQRTYMLRKPVTLNPGEKLALRCQWDNSPENQPIIEGIRIIPRDVRWGEGTFDEMCLGVFSYTLTK
jgi:hypothetical protein